MFVVIAAGGTAGHINPALALADELVKRGHQVSFVGTHDKLEATLVREAGYEFFGIDVAGFNRSRPWTLFTSAAKMLKASYKISRAFIHRSVDVSIGFGAYVEVPLALASDRLDIPFALHEQNSVPGMANLQMARKASLIALSYPVTEASFRKKASSHARIVTTGNPVRSSVLEATRSRGRGLFQVGENNFLLTIFGGSLGARRINRASIEGIPELLTHFPELIVVQGTGVDGFNMVQNSQASIGDLKKRWRIYPYIEQMGHLIAASDLVLSRAGASSLAEITSLGIPSILIPYPYARGDHQRMNAEFLVERGAARLIADVEFDGEKIISEIAPLISHPSDLSELRKAAVALESENAALRLADELEQLV